MRTRDEIREGTIIELAGVLQRTGKEQHAIACYGVLDAGIVSLARAHGTGTAVGYLYQTADEWAQSIAPGMAGLLLDGALERPPAFTMTRRRRFMVWCFRHQILIGCAYGVVIGLGLGFSIAVGLRVMQ